MKRPQPGDRVKVTLYGTYKYGFVVDGEDRCLVLSNDGIGWPLLTSSIHVEVVDEATP